MYVHIGSKYKISSILYLVELQAFNDNRILTPSPLPPLKKGKKENIEHFYS